MRLSRGPCEESPLGCRRALELDVTFRPGLDPPSIASSFGAATAPDVTANGPIDTYTASPAIIAPPLVYAPALSDDACAAPAALTGLLLRTSTAGVFGTPAPGKPLIHFVSTLLASLRGRLQSKYS